MQKPRIPRLPIQKNPFPKVLLGMVIAVSVGVGASLGANMIDTSVHSAAELRELLQLPVLASIDAISTPHDIKVKHFRRRTFIIALVIFVILSQIFVSWVM